MRRPFVLGLVALSAATFVAAVATAAPPASPLSPSPLSPSPPSASPPSTSPNAVQVEMRLLEDAMKTSVAAIARGDVRGLPKLLHQVHLAAGDTTAHLRRGDYVLPQHSGDIDAFVALDAAFHTEMIRMVSAAKRNDVETTANAFGNLMVRCHACHAHYSDPPPAAAKE